MSQLADRPEVARRRLVIDHELWIQDHPGEGVKAPVHRGLIGGREHTTKHHFCDLRGDLRSCQRSTSESVSAFSVCTKHSWTRLLSRDRSCRVGRRAGEYCQGSQATRFLGQEERWVAARLGPAQERAPAAQQPRLGPKGHHLQLQFASPREVAGASDQSETYTRQCQAAPRAEDPEG